MKYGFIPVACATPEIKVADCDFNTQQIIHLIDEGAKKDIKIMVFPELCVTGYTCGDLFLQNRLLQGALDGVKIIRDYSSDKDMVVIISIPYERKSKLYNTAVVIHRGKVLGLVPKINIPNYSEFYEGRYFVKGNEKAIPVEFLGQETYFGSKILFEASNVAGLCLAVETCEDLWVPLSPSINHALAGATVIANPSASDEYTGKATYRRNLIKQQSGKLVCAYLYADAGEGESTTDLVYAGHNLIAENGTILKESDLFGTGLIYTEIDVERLNNERRRMSTSFITKEEDYHVVSYVYETTPKIHHKLTRWIDPLPYVPYDIDDRLTRCKEVTDIQAVGLKKRITHVNTRNIVLGLSGGLDSTLAILVACKAFDELGYDRKDIIAVTMPGLGTTDRTYLNALSLAKFLGTTLREIPIKEAVLLHFNDIGHDVNVHDVTYENSQARERTQILMDLAGMYQGFVLGTGDMSELALGWATYNGDHMSMYGVNSSVPKTLVRHLVSYFARTTEEVGLKEVLEDILDTPVSPELLPAKGGKITQITEDIVGPYELHDFFLYYILRFGFEPTKIYELAVGAFTNRYSKEIILKWIKVFYRRFFTQQFKRSCLPDGPKIGSLTLSPRGDFRMPSDASYQLWLSELDKIVI